MTSAEMIRGTRSAAGLFEMEDRGLLEVHGEDRVRWLDGMVSGDIEALMTAESGAGCYATLLTNRGAIVADLHIGRLGDLFVLESRRDQIDKIRTTLDRFIIADDVRLDDRSSEFEILAIEGPAAAEVLARSAGVPIDFAPESWHELEIAGRAVRVGCFGWSGEEGFQIHAAIGERAPIASALEEAARESGIGIVRGDAASLEVMRIEAGLPALGAELDEDVLPAEARLERAIAPSKGCYVGQEIVARLRARGQVNHLLVGLEVEGATLPPIEAELTVDGRKTGEITSAAESPDHGRIALGYVRREHSDPGTRVDFDGGTARVVDLPFTARSAESRNPTDSR